MAKPRQRRRALKQRKVQQAKRQRLVTILVIAGVVLVIFAAIIVAQNRQSAQATPTISANVVTPQPREHPNANDNTMGDPNAPVTIIEYSDFQCPYCLRFYQQIEPDIINKEVAQGRVRFIYRTMGNFIGQESLDAAEAAYCAGEQNRFWDYHDILFANWQGENQGSFTPERLTKFAEVLGLDMKAFQSCFKSHKYRARAMKDKQDGIAAGVHGTPSFVIIAPDGSKKLLEGAYPYEEFHKAIEEALKKQP